MFEFFKQFVSCGGIVFDIGANVGNRTQVFLDMGATVVAVEPQLDCIAVLEAKFGNTASCHIVKKAVGAAEGQHEINISNANTITSMSPKWIEAVRDSGRFAGYTWRSGGMIEVTTLDQLISQFGLPEFIKIDVEGFEFEVIQGLNRAVPAISFEFTPEYLDAAINSIQRLRQIGEISLNYSLGESMRFEFDEFASAESTMTALQSYCGSNRVFGDVYCRFINVPNCRRA